MLTQWQDVTLETARKNLADDNYLTPYVFMLVLPDRMKESAKRQLSFVKIRDDSAVDTREPVDWTAMDPEEFSVAILPQEKTDEEWWHIATELLVPPEKRPALEMLNALGAAAGKSPAVVRKHFVEEALKQRGWEIKDLLALHIRDVLRRMGALAYCKVDDGYSLDETGPHGKPGPLSEEEMKQRIAEGRKKHPASLENYERATEAVLVQLETPTFVRLLTLPYQRTERNTGKVTAFAEKPTERLVERVAKGEQMLTGRFMWMLEAPA